MGDFAKHVQALRQEVEKAKSLLALQDLVTLLEKSDGAVKQAEANAAEMARLRDELRKAQQAHTESINQMQAACTAKCAEIDAQAESYHKRIGDLQSKLASMQADFEEKKSAASLEINHLKEAKRVLNAELAGLNATIERARAEHAKFLQKVAG